MEQKKSNVGRPKKAPDMVDLDTAVELIKQEFRKKGIPEDKCKYSKQTLYNKINEGKLRRHGTRACVLLEKDQVLGLAS